MKTNWQDPGSTEIRSTQIAGLQGAIGKIEDVLDLQITSVTGASLSEVYISADDRYRIYQVTDPSQRNWVASPAPVIKKNGIVVSSGFEIDYAGGAVILNPSLTVTDVVTADFSYVKSSAGNFSLPQTKLFQIFNTVDELINYEKIYIGFSGNVAILGTTKAGVGVYRDLKFRVGDVDRIYIRASDGMVGIGTISPAKELSIGGTAGVHLGFQPYGRTEATSGIYATEGAAAGSGILSLKTQVSSGGGLIDRLKVDENGNIGIGGGTININGFSSGWTVLTIGGASGRAGIMELNSGLLDGDGVNVGDIVFNQITNTLAADKRVAYIRCLTEGTTANYRGGKLIFSTRPNGGSLLDRMVIDNQGRVGIGTTPTSDALEINGNIRMVSGFTIQTIGGNLVLNADGANDILFKQNGGTVAGFYDGLLGIGCVPGYALDVLVAGDGGIRARTSGISNAARINLESGNGTTSGRYTYMTFATLETSPQDWRIGMYGSKEWIVRDNTGAYQLITCLAGTGRTGILSINPQWTLDVGSGWVNSVSGYKTNGADYGEYFESLDGQKIPFGVTVILEGDKVRPAQPGEMPMGSSSATCSWVGNNGGSEWPKKYLRNELGEELFEEYQEEIMAVKKELVPKERPVTFTYKVPTVTHEIREVDGRYVQVSVPGFRDETITLCDEYPLYNEVGEVIGTHKVPQVEEYMEEVEVQGPDGRPVMVGTGEYKPVQRPKLNPEYDPARDPYAKREDRPEWNVIALVGQVRILKGQPVAPGWVKMKDISETVELWLVK